jgi:hypothetical protein
MAIAKFDINSTSVGGNYGIVDIFIANTQVASNLQLSSELMFMDPPIDTLAPGTYTVRIDLLNSEALDMDNDGYYTGPDDETMIVQFANLEIANDDVNFVSYPVPMVPNVRPESNSINVYGLDTTFEFTIS